jgi:hypothetical protein
MPSAKDPNDVVNPGPGKLPAGTVPTSALFSPGGGGGDGGMLLAHINDPTDAHMAGAIGIPPYYPPTGEALLWSVEGPIDGESVLDFIAAVKDLYPDQPNRLGFNDTSIPNSGRPVIWSNQPYFRRAAFTRGGVVVFSKRLLHHSTPYLPTAAGFVFPADRGVLAIYKNVTDGDYYNSANTTLLGALHLGGRPGGAPAGIPDANFIESVRTGQQANYTGTHTGIDRFNLTYRLPFLKNYAAWGSPPYTNYSADFYRYQLARYEVPATDMPVTPGAVGGMLLVHWKESYATSLAAIQPASLTALTHVAANCYSAVPTGGDFDVDPNIFSVNLHNFMLAGNAVSPTCTITATPAGSPTTMQLSGLTCYAFGLQVDAYFTANNLFNDAYDVGTAANPNIPAGMEGDLNPVTIYFTYAGKTQGLGYYDLQKLGSGTNYSPVIPPLTTDVAEWSATSLGVPGETPYTVTSGSGYGSMGAGLQRPFGGGGNGSLLFLYNSYDQSGVGTLSDSTFEPLVDEKYRYVSNYAGTVVNPPVEPAVGDKYDSTVVISNDTPDLQVIGHAVKYPQEDYSGMYPAGNPDYVLYTGDTPNLIRRYVRIFDTGVARNTGKIRVRGNLNTPVSTFLASVTYSGLEVNDHPGGGILQIKIPGVTGWLDLGRVKGDPDLGTTDFHGCRTGLVVSAYDYTFEYDTTEYTSNNGAGEFPLLVRVSIYNGGSVLTKMVEELEWLAP